MGSPIYLPQIPADLTKTYIKTNKVNMSPYEMRVVFTKPLYMRFANTEKSKKLIEIYDTQMVKLLKAGEIEEIFNKWGNPFIPFQPRK